MRRGRRGDEDRKRGDEERTRGDEERRGKRGSHLREPRVHGTDFPSCIAGR